MKTVLFVVFVAIVGMVQARPENGQQPAATMCINPPQQNSEKENQNSGDKQVQATSQQPAQMSSSENAASLSEKAGSISEKAGNIPEKTGSMAEKAGNVAEKAGSTAEKVANMGEKVESMGEKYTTKYDNIDIQEILKSDRLLKGYFNCLMEKGACTPDGEELKNSLPDALHTACAKCNERQRQGTRTVIHYLIDNKRDLWNELENKYDKNGEYRKRYQAEINKEGLKL